jgi:hypothetical protein
MIAYTFAAHSLFLTAGIRASAILQIFLLLTFHQINSLLLFYHSRPIDYYAKNGGGKLGSTRKSCEKVQKHTEKERKRAQKGAKKLGKVSEKTRNS